MKKPVEKTEQWRAENFKTWGFEIYDYLHLLSAVTMVVLLLIYWHDIELVRAEVSLFKEIVFFFMSGLLIFFVAFIAENEDPHSERLVYNFCWLIASLILFMPALFDLIIFFIDGVDLAAHAGIFISDMASMIFPILSLSFFILGILRIKNVHHWLNLMLTGVCFFLFATIAEIVEIITELSVEGFTAILLVELITALAPIAPAIFGFHDFHLLRVYMSKHNGQAPEDETH